MTYHKRMILRRGQLAAAGGARRAAMDTPGRPVGLAVSALLAAAGVFACLTVAARAGAGEGDPTAPRDANAPSSDVDYWLGRAAPADANDAGVAVDPDRAGPGGGVRSARPDALDGAVVLSDGNVLAGSVYGTPESPWRVYVEARRRWRRVPHLAVSHIEAVVVREEMELEWRWKAMGEPERVYTGRSFPVRRLLWRFVLIDGTSITGAVKGQPLWVRDADGGTHGPMVLGERTKGEVGQSLAELVYVRKVILSKRAMRAARRRAGQAAPD